MPWQLQPGCYELLDEESLHPGWGIPLTTEFLHFIVVEATSALPWVAPDAPLLVDISHSSLVLQGETSAAPPNHIHSFLSCESFALNVVLGNMIDRLSAIIVPFRIADDMESVLEPAQRLPLSILLYGRVGAGKRSVARKVHYNIL